MIPPEGRTRSYYHHFIRLSYVLPDLGMITKPCLNIVDAHRAVASWRRTACDQGLVYREEQKRLLDEYRGDFTLSPGRLGRLERTGANEPRQPKEAQR